MKILIFHNLLWSQYKSVVFEQLDKQFNEDNTSSLLVVQTAITEHGRKDLLEFDISTFPFKYNFQLISKKALEDVNQLKIFFFKLKTFIQYKPDVVNFTGYNESSIIFLLLWCKLFNIKTIITNESISNSLKKNDSLKILKYWFKVVIFKLTDGFFSYGIQSNDFLFKHKVDKKKILSFLNTFDKSKFQVSNDRNLSIDFKFVLFVGRLSEEKNLLDLIDSFEVISKKITDLKLIIIGDGPERDTLLRQINQLNMSQKIHLLGTIKWSQLAEYYQRAKCLLLPSKSETWGMVANEAQELNLPVICSKSCGCADDLIIDNYSGLVIHDQFNSEKNNEKIIYFLENKTGKALDQFINNNKKIFNLDRLAMEMNRGFHYLFDK